MMASNMAPANHLPPPQGGLGLSPAELRALEGTRFRLQNLTNSLASFQHDLYMTPGSLPNPQSLQTSAGILKHHTTYLLEILSKHSALFQRLAVHPSPNYPGRTQEDVLGVFLRKKLEPQVETLVEAARDEALAAGISPHHSFVSQEGLLAQRERERAERRQAKFGFSMGGVDAGGESSSEEDDGDEGEGSSGSDDEGGERVNEPIPLGDVWVDSMAWCRERLKRFAHEFEESLYTAEERAMGIENVRTGLKRSLEEEEEEEEDSDDDDEDDSDEEDGEGDTAMKDMQPIAPSSGQPAGQPGIGGGAAAEEDRKRLAMDEVRMVSLLARGEGVAAQPVPNLPAGAFQPR